MQPFSGCTAVMITPAKHVLLNGLHLRMQFASTTQCLPVSRTVEFRSRVRSLPRIFSSRELLHFNSTFSFQDVHCAQSCAYERRTRLTREQVAVSVIGVIQLSGRDVTVPISEDPLYLALCIPHLMHYPT